MLGECYIRLHQKDSAIAQYRELKELDAEMAGNLSRLIEEAQFRIDPRNLLT
jgi:hypothetical protein